MKLREIAGEIADEATPHLHGCRFWDGGRCNCERLFFVVGLDLKIQQLCREERARGLRAAARSARRKAEDWGKVKESASACKDYARADRCHIREIALRVESRRYDRRARAIEKGRK